MQVSIIVKEVNSEFRQDIADRHNAGKESVDNMHYNWEDEYAVKGDIKQFKIYNNVPFALEGLRGETAFKYEIPGMMVVECTAETGEVTRFAFSRKLVKETQKVERADQSIRFFVFIRDRKPHANPLPGVYILNTDWPNDLPLPPVEEDFYDEEE